MTYTVKLLLLEFWEHRLNGKAFKTWWKGHEFREGVLLWPCPALSRLPLCGSSQSQASPFPWQGGRGDLPEHHRAQRHSAGSQRTQGVPEMPQAAAGGGAGDGNASTRPTIPEALGQGGGSGWGTRANWKMLATVVVFTGWQLLVLLCIWMRKDFYCEKLKVQSKTKL